MSIDISNAYFALIFLPLIIIGLSVVIFKISKTKETEDRE
jgi:hypothetical protein